MASDAKGTLPEDSDRNLRPALERLIHDHGRIDILFSMDRSHGGSRGGLYEDITFQPGPERRDWLLGHFVLGWGSR